MSCYLIAKDIYKNGCLALKTRHGAELVALKRELIGESDSNPYVLE